MKTGLQKIKIEDTSDCITCTMRHKAHWELLRRAKVKILNDVSCSECGRKVHILVEEEKLGD